jgi:four helix bundle protein
MGGTVKKFEDLRAWQEGREIIRQIYSLSECGAFRKDFGLRDQIRRAAVSINLNIAEGFARGTDKEFSHYLMQTRGSIAEVQSALYVALDQQYIQSSDFDNLYASLERLSRMITTLSSYLRDSTRRRSASAKDS